MAHCVIAKGKGTAEATTRRDYRLQLACERVTGIPEPGGYVSAAMQRGIDLEAKALAAYEALTGEMVERTGFLQHVTHLAGCSLDGHIDGFRGIQEFKAPKSATHLAYWRDPASFEREYMAQVTHNLWVTGAEWCDLVSYDDRMPPKLQTLVRRVYAKDAGLPEWENGLLRFLAEVQIEVQGIQQLLKEAA
jgi:hypothetical protein